MSEYVKKELRVSLKGLFNGVLLLFGVFAAVALIVCVGVGSAFEGSLDFSMLFEPEVSSRFIAFLGVALVFVAVYLYQYFNNILVYGNFGFVVNEKTYSYQQVSKLKSVHRGRNGTFYHLYVEDEVVFKFSTMYANKDDFISVLQKNGVPIIA